MRGGIVVAVHKTRLHSFFARIVQFNALYSQSMYNLHSIELDHDFSVLKDV